MRNTILDFMRDAKDGTDPDEYDSAGMVKLYLKHGPPVYGWVDTVGEDGIIGLIVARDRVHTDAARRYSAGDYPLYVPESEVAMFRFTDVYEFMNRTTSRDY